MGLRFTKTPPETPFISPDQLETGDILLFHGHTTMDVGVQIGTRCPWGHAAIVCRDPDFTMPKLRGLYIWESSTNNFQDAEDHRYKMGVQMVDASKRFAEAKSLGTKIYVRKLHDVNRNSHIFQSKLATAHNLLHNLPYDTTAVDWLRALAIELGFPAYYGTLQHKDRFWCSAMVSCVLVKLGLLPADLPWSTIAPEALSSHARNPLPWNQDLGYFGPDTYLWMDAPPKSKKSDC